MIVALECAGRVGSIGVLDDAGTVQVCELDGTGSQAAQLLPALEQLLVEAGGSLAAVRGIIVGEGPGSFTGVRVAAAAGLGLSQALGCPLHRASSLTAALFGAPELPDAGAHAVLFDARGERLYLAGYEWRDRRLSVTLSPRFAHVSDMVARSFRALDDARLCGDGADRHLGVLVAAGFELAAPGAGRAHARGLLQLWSELPEQVAVWAEGEEPAYLRASSAEREAGLG